MRDDPLQRAAVQRQQRAVLHRPAEPRGGEAERRGRGQTGHLLAATWRISRPDAVEERIAGRQHADRLAAPRQDSRERAVDGEGQAIAARPRPPTRARCRVPPTTRQACAMRRRAAGESPSSPSSPMPMIDSHRPGAVTGPHLAEANRCDFLFSAARRRRARWRAALAGRADVAAILSLAGRTGNPAPSPIPLRVGGFGGAAGLRDYLKAERDRRGDRRHPPVRRADVAPRR